MKTETNKNQIKIDEFKQAIKYLENTIEGLPESMTDDLKNQRNRFVFMLSQIQKGGLKWT